MESWSEVLAAVDGAAAALRDPAPGEAPGERLIRSRDLLTEVCAAWEGVSRQPLEAASAERLRGRVEAVGLLLRQAAAFHTGWLPHGIYTAAGGSVAADPVRRHIWEG